MFFMYAAWDAEYTSWDTEGRDWLSKEEETPQKHGDE